MKNKAPRFWHDDNALFLPIILTPFSILYQACALFYALFSTPKALGVPVICVGNLVAGGAGKTPTAIAISKLLYDRGENPHFLCRGYGGRLKGPIKVNPDNLTFFIIKISFVLYRIQSLDFALIGFSI